MNRAAVVGLLCFSNAAWANGDMCSSNAFRATFLEGQGVVEDEATMGEQFVSFGDAAIPCLKAVALQGEQTLGIRCRMQELAGGCRTWAVLGLATLHSQAAQGALLEIANASTVAPVAAAAVHALAGHGPVARAGLQGLLQHHDVDVRTEVLVALAHLREPSDQAALVQVAIGLPDLQFRTAAIALAAKVDGSGAAVLRERANRIQDPGLRASAYKALSP